MGESAHSAEIARALNGVRLYELRTGFEQPGPCHAPADEARSPIRCSAAQLEVAQLSALSRALRSIDSAAEPALHARARLLLATEARSLDETIDELLRVFRRQSDSALLNDLAIAHALRATEHNHARDIFDALEYIELASRRDSANVIVQFNRAALLERLHLQGEAGEAWRRYLTLADAGEWQSEARSRLAGLTDTARTANPQSARERAVEVLLPLWARLYEGGMPDSAEVVLREAEQLAAELAVRGERTAEQALLRIRELAAQPARLRALARGLSDFARGRELYRSGNHLDAVAALHHATTELQPFSPAFDVWPALLLAGVHLFAGEHEQSLGRFHDIATRADPALYPAARARAQWGRGLVLTRQGRAEAGRMAYDSAGALFERLGERENLGAIRLLVGEAEGILGLHARSWSNLLLSLQALAATPNSMHRHTLLAVLGRQLTDHGLRAAAVAVHREGLRVAGATGRRKDEVEALVRLARAEVLFGNRASAEANLARATTLLDSITDAVMHDQLAADIASASAELTLAVEPQRAVTSLTVAVEQFQRQRLPLSLLPALARRGDAYARAGDRPRARADLQRAVALIETEAGNVQDIATRVSLLEAATPAFDALIALDLAASDDMAAWHTLQRARAAASVVNGALPQTAGRLLTLSETQRRLAPDLAIIEYGVLPDRLLIWVLRHDTVVLRTHRAAEPELRALAMQFEQQVSSARHNEDIGATALQLGAVLLAPVAPLLADSREIVIVPDKVLHRVPFAALQLPGRQGFLIENVALRTAASVTALFRHRPATAAARTGHMLLVGNPRYDPAAFPDLQQLTAADREVERVAATAAGQALVLGGEQATRSAVLRELSNAQLFHFAGHARFRADRPSQSYLVTAAEHGRSDVVTAEDIRKLRLSDLRLVVLSACETLTPTTGRSGGFDALAGAFLASGARAVLGTLWQVDDAASAEFVPRFHQLRAEGLSNAEALREMQRRMLTSGDPRYAAPAEWAGFRLEGQ